eukprot:SAG22_NODE_665_length_8020_cov_22.612296_4_plen_80_part_00
MPVPSLGVAAGRPQCVRTNMADAAYTRLETAAGAVSSTAADADESGSAPGPGLSEKLMTTRFATGPHLHHRCIQDRGCP